MPEVTIHFDNAREIQDVTGRRGEYLPRVERAFDVRLTSRDTWLRVEGAAEATAAVQRFVEGLRRAVERIHDCGICVIGAFIFGNDHDDS